MNKYSEFVKLSKLLGDISFATSDEDSGKYIAKQIVERDRKYTELLQSYTKITKIRFALKEIHKWLFFWMVIGACFCCLLLAYKLIDRILVVDDSQFIVDSAPVIVAAFTAFVSTVIAVPMAITKFLFNTNEDDNITQLIQHTQEHDAAGMDKLKDKFSKKLSNKVNKATKGEEKGFSEVSGD